MSDTPNIATLSIATPEQTPGTPLPQETPGTPTSKETPGTPSPKETPGTPMPHETQPIPTAEEISACTDFIYEECPDQEGSKVVRMGKYAAKYGGRTKPREVENMRFLADYPNINAPKCYASGYIPYTWRSQQSSHFYIVTDYIEGETVEDGFEKLSPVDQEEVIRLIREQIHELRSIPDPGYLGGVGNTHYVHHIFKLFPHTEREKMLIGYNSGPFANYGAFVDWWTQQTKARKHRNNPRWDPVSDFTEVMVRDAWQHHQRTVFTHGDIAPKNMILTRLGTNPDGSGIFRVTLIDWELAGFYPEWWEFADAPFFWGATPKWWVESISKVMPMYFRERWVLDFYSYLLTWG